MSTAVNDEHADNEFQKGDIRRGLWVKAQSLADGDERVAKARYIKLRAEEMASAANANRRAKSELLKTPSVKSYTGWLIYGWFLCASALYLLTTTVFVWADEPDPTASSWFLALKTIVGISQAILWIATGVAILKRKTVAIPLLWAMVILGAIGVFFRGIIPIDLALWSAQAYLAWWFSSMKSSLSP